jgi:Uma2 family endonuclease
MVFRIAMSTVAEALLTWDQFLALPDQAGKQEFDRGRVIVMPPPKYIHTLTAKRIYDRLVTLLRDSGLIVFSEAGFLIAPGVVRQPDVAVVEEGRLQDAEGDQYLAGAPVIAIEVVSPGNTAEELDLKIDQYLRGGSQAVWVAYPKRQAIVRFALVAGRIRSEEFRSGETFSEDIVSPGSVFDPAEFF